jgi:Zn-dependent protease with chaperone function
MLRHPALDAECPTHRLSDQILAVLLVSHGYVLLFVLQNSMAGEVFRLGLAGHSVVTLWQQHMATARGIAPTWPALPHIPPMLKLTPILIAILYALVMYRFSVWRTKRELDARSTELLDPVLRCTWTGWPQALDLPRIRVHIYEIDPVNGLAAPDGRIFITRGFYRKYREGEVTADEMASVIAHELGHVALGHSRGAG